MNKKIIFSVLIIVVALAIILVFCFKNKEDKNMEIAKLVDEYAPFEFTVKYPKDAGYKFEADLDVTEFAKSEELKNILSSMTINDKIEGKKVDGIISSNHKLIVKKIENPDASNYYVNQDPDSNGVTSIYGLNEVNKYKGESVSFRLISYGNEGNYQNLDTCLAYQEKTFKKKFEDYNLFGQKVKVDVSRHAIGGSSSPEKYKTWMAGYFEKDGKVYDFLYIQYVGIEDSLGEKLVNNVLNNFTIND